MLRNLLKKSNLSINNQWRILTINYSSNTNLDIEKLEKDTTSLEGNTQNFNPNPNASKRSPIL